MNSTDAMLETCKFLTAYDVYCLWRVNQHFKTSLRKEVDFILRNASFVLVLESALLQRNHSLYLTFPHSALVVEHAHHELQIVSPTRMREAELFLGKMYNEQSNWKHWNEIDNKSPFASGHLIDEAYNIQSKYHQDDFPYKRIAYQGRGGPLIQLALSQSISRRSRSSERTNEIILALDRDPGGIPGFANLGHPNLLNRTIFRVSEVCDVIDL